uniref:Uncharacterized protein n=1 Tax=Manihot esculenta TaxID=3983 RepID=A0A2C9VZ72_MANES
MRSCIRDENAKMLCSFIKRKMKPALTAFKALHLESTCGRTKTQGK